MPLFGPPDVEKIKAKRDIDGLIKAMSYARDAKIRQAAATALGEIGDNQAVEPLIVAFRNKHPVLKDRREAVAKALGKIGDVRAVRPLASALSQYEDETVREAAIEELIKFGVRAVDALITELKASVIKSSKDDLKRNAVIKALLGIGPLCINALIDALEKSGRDVGRWGWNSIHADELEGLKKALVAFGAPTAQPLVTKLRQKAQYGDQESLSAQRALSDSIKALSEAGALVIDLLIPALQDSNPAVREKFVEVLVEIKEPRAIEPIIAALSDEDERVSKIAVRALKGRSEQRAIEALKTREDKHKQVREIVAEARLKTDMYSMKRLISLLQNEESNVRSAAVEALKDIGDTRAVEPLIIALQDEYIRFDAAIGLGRIRDIRAVEPLINLLKDKSLLVREASIQALGQIGDARAVESVIVALKDSSSISVMRAAACTLGQIRDVRAVQPLILALKLNGTQDMRLAEEIAKALIEINDKTGADTLLDYLFGLQEARPLHLSQLIPVDVLIGFPQDLKNFFGDYTQFIAKTVSIKSAGHPESFSLHYILDENNSALEALCKINTPLASNVLHRVSNRRDITAPKNYYSESGSWTTHQLSLESLRNIAKAELLRRGNPPYDPGIYLNEIAWKI